MGKRANFIFIYPPFTRAPHLRVWGFLLIGTGIATCDPTSHSAATARKMYGKGAASLYLHSFRWGVEQKSLALWYGRAVQPTADKRRALFEPFDKTPDRLRKFAHHRGCHEISGGKYEVVHCTGKALVDTKVNAVRAVPCTGSRADQVPGETQHT